MSFIDVSDVILDPMVADQVVTVVRRQQAVNAQGEDVVAETLVPGVVAAVYPTGDESLVREEAFSAQNQTIAVCTIFRLRGQTRDAAGASWLPDLVIWDGNPYIVRSVNDFTRFGAGFVEAECEAFNWQQRPAEPQPAQSGRVDFSQLSQAGLAALLANPPHED